MKIKFIDSQNRIRTVFTNDVNYHTLTGLYNAQKKFYGGDVFKEKLPEFIASLSKDDIENYKYLIFRRTGIPMENIEDLEIVGLNENALKRYGRWLRGQLTENPNQKQKVAFYWDDEAFAKKYNNYGQEDERKIVDYQYLVKEIFPKYKIQVSEGKESWEEKDDTSGVSFSNSEVTDYLEGTKKNFDDLAVELTKIINDSLKAPSKELTEGGSSKNMSSEVSAKQLKNLKQGKDPQIAKKIKELKEAITNREITLNNLKKEYDKNKDAFLSKRIKSLSDIIDKNKKELNSLNELEGSKELNQEEAELIENPDLYTVDEIKKLCYKEVENVYDDLAGYKGNEYTGKFADSDWYNAKDVKLVYNLGDTKLVRNDEVFDYFEVNKELEKHYYDSKETNYEKWLLKNPNIINDTLNKMSERGKPMNDSLKNVKFRFTDGIEIEVLDSEGKNFKEVKDEVIQVHRQMMKKSVKDSEETKCAKETKEVLEENGVKTDDSALWFLPMIEMEEKYKQGVSKEEYIDKWMEEHPTADKEWVNSLWDFMLEKVNKENETENSVEDSVEETSGDKYKVIVNGKEIGIYDTLEEAEEAEKKALEAVEKGIPKVEMEDCDKNLEDCGDSVNDDRMYEDDQEQAAFENALDCLTYGVGKNDWNSCGLPEEKATEIWRAAFKYLAQEM